MPIKLLLWKNKWNYDKNIHLITNLVKLHFLSLWYSSFYHFATIKRIGTWCIYLSPWKPDVSWQNQNKQKTKQNNNNNKNNKVRNAD